MRLRTIAGKYGGGGPDIALDVWVTREQEGLKSERLLRNLLLFHNPDTQSSVWATPPQSDTATFEVSIPSVSMTASVDDIEFGVDADLGPIVHLNGHGMKFERSLDIPPKGAYRWTQLVVHNKVSYTNDGTNWIDTERQGGVDNKVSMSDELEVTDSPALQYTLGGHVGIKRDFKARMYLMWKHNSANSIWVPLYMTTWKMEFEIEKIGMSWDFVGDPGSAEIIIGPVREWNLPLWERIYRNDDPYVTI